MEAELFARWVTGAWRPDLLALDADLAGLLVEMEQEYRLAQGAAG